MKKIFLSFFLFTILSFWASAQNANEKKYFRQESVTGSNTVTISTEKGETKVIEYIMAYGEDAKSLRIQINKGFAFKLAPGGSANLNYVGSSLGIVLKDGDVATIELTESSAKNAEKHIYVSGYSCR